MKEVKGHQRAKTSRTLGRACASAIPRHARNRTGKRDEGGAVVSSRGGRLGEDRLEWVGDIRLRAKGESTFGEVVGVFGFFASEASAGEGEVKFGEKGVLVFVLLAVGEGGKEGAGFSGDAAVEGEVFAASFGDTGAFDERIEIFLEESAGASVFVASEGDLATYGVEDVAVGGAAGDLFGFAEGEVGLT